MVNWDRWVGSAISDLEVEEKEVEDIMYDLEDRRLGEGRLLATVRPVTMLGDTAVAVNPADERFRELIGETVIVPLIVRRGAR